MNAGPLLAALLFWFVTILAEWTVLLHCGLLKAHDPLLDKKVLIHNVEKAARYAGGPIQINANGRLTVVGITIGAVLAKCDVDPATAPCLGHLDDALGLPPLLDVQGRPIDTHTWLTLNKVGVITGILVEPDESGVDDTRVGEALQHALGTPTSETDGLLTWSMPNNQVVNFATKTAFGGQASRAFVGFRAGTSTKSGDVL